MTKFVKAKERSLKIETSATTSPDEALYDAAVVWSIKRLQRNSGKETRESEDMMRQKLVQDVCDVVADILSREDHPARLNLPNCCPLLPRTTLTSASGTRHCSPLFVYRFTNVEDMQKLFRCSKLHGSLIDLQNYEDNKW